jgi:xanthine/uracil permease
MLTAALTIAIALTLPSAASGSEWVNALPSGLEVFVSSGIVLSVVVGAVLNLFVGQVLEPFVNGRVSTAEETVETADD